MLPWFTAKNHPHFKQQTNHQKTIHHLHDFGVHFHVNFQVSNEKNPGYLLYIGDYTTQLYGDYNYQL